MYSVSRGQLGHGTLQDEPDPKLIEALSGMKVRKIATGSWHSCAVTASGDLYTWGWNSNGQLGLVSKSNPSKNVSVMATPHAVTFENWETCNVTNVACGAKHTVTLLGE